MSTRAIRRIVLLSLVGTALVYFGVATWVEERRIEDQRAARGAVPAAGTPRLDGNQLISTVRTLASPEFEGRRTGSPGGLKARAWIAERFTSIGLETVGRTFLHPFSFTHTSIKGIVDPNRPVRTEYTDAANIVGLCKGTAVATEMMVITAHYDHLGVRDGVMFPGADDNASGVAVMLAIAERCTRAPFKHDAMFVAFDAEELGLQGAKAFVANPPVPRERLRLNVNLDMVSRSDRRELFVAGTYHWPAAKPALEEVAKRAPVRLLFGHDRPAAVAGGVQDWTTQSDHGPFHQSGIPFVYFGVEDHADYHRPTDTADKIDPAFFRDAADTILDAILTLDQTFPVAG